MTGPDMTTGYDLVVASHWLPVRYDQGAPQWRASAGSTTNALAAVVSAHRGAWIGWGGTTGPEPETAIGDLWLHPLHLTEQEIDDYHHGHCARTLVPLYQDCGIGAQFHHTWRDAYREINHRYARAAARLAAPGATVWIHDLHLQLMPGYLRRLRNDVRIGFFLHGLFPPPEQFLQQPLRRQIMRGLLGADLVGFQQARSARNFVDLAADLTGLRRSEDIVQVGPRQVRVGTFPTSVDAAGIGSLATDPDVRARAAAIRESLGNPRTVLLSIGRSVTSEGVDRRLEAYSQLLAERRLDPDDVVLVHVAGCGDEQDPHEDCRHRIDRQIAQINGVRARVGRPAIHYLRHELQREELIALYLAADIMLATPLRQGMTLTAKEFAATRVDDTGCLVLSEFSGAGADLPEAIRVNPHDVDAVKAAIMTAAVRCHAPTGAMRAMRRRVLDRDAARWSADFLTALAETGSVTPEPAPWVDPDRAVLTAQGTA